MFLVTDRDEMTAPEKIERAQGHMVSALRLLVQRRYRGHRNADTAAEMMMAHMLVLLYDMRMLTDMHRVQEEKIGMEWSSQITFPPVLHEMCT